MAALGTLLLSILDKVLGLFSKQGDANAAAVSKQGGVDAERSASLAAQNTALQAQVAAAVNAPKTTDDVIARADKGTL